LSFIHEDSLGPAPAGHIEWTATFGDEEGWAGVNRSVDTDVRRPGE
jgi:hypothetical protein